MGVQHLASGEKFFVHFFLRNGALQRALIPRFSPAEQTTVDKNVQCL